MISVDVLVLTYKRPAWLADTLRSLVKQRLSDETRMAVIVIDNDAAQSARAIVNEFQGSLRDIRYFCEPEANVARARNRALAEAHSRWAAFIDDDEMADADWLEALLRAQRRYGAPIVLGPVAPRLPADAPRWAVTGRFFDRPRFVTGATHASGGTGNVLLDLAAVSSAQVLFEPAYGKTGGEDTHFFYRLRAAGLASVWCDEAVVHEQVGLERVRVGWLVRRAFSGGHCYARIFDGGRSAWSLSARVLLHFAAFLGFLFLVPLAACAGRPSATRMIQRCARHLGRSSGMCRMLEPMKRSSNEPAATAI